MISANNLPAQLEAIRTYYQSGATRTYVFRIRQLRLLKAAILKNENEISDALYSDLKKSPEEAYATETGQVISEINLALKNLNRWMKPQRVKTNLLNFPSSSKILHDPRGVVLIISPWNYPLQLLLVPLVGAMAAGNCVVLKPSELAPATAHVIKGIIGGVFSPDYIKVFLGEGAELIPPMIESFRFDYIFYTGGIAVGKSIYEMAAKNLIPVTLELGGKSPAIIESDASLSVAAKRIIIGKFINAGQTCVAPDYLLIHKDIFEKFVIQLKETIIRFFGDNARESYDYGKIINENRFDTLVSYLSEGEIISGGDHDRASLYIGPTILKNIALDSSIMEEEIFGPILPVISFNTMEEALATIQKNENPLAFYVFTSDRKKEKAWLDKAGFGGGCVNNTIYHFSNPYLPFGGLGKSGIGFYHGRYSFATFTHSKPVMKTPTWLDPAMKYPPFRGKLKWLTFFIK